jgi:hypothetical protein
MTHLILHGSKIEVHLTHELGLEGYDLQINDHIAAQMQVVEEQIKVVILTRDIQMMLLSDKGKALSQFEQEILQAIGESFFELPLGNVRAEPEKLEIVGILDELLSEIGLRSRQGGREIRQCCSLATVQVGLDLMNEHGT